MPAAGRKPSQSRKRRAPTIDPAKTKTLLDGIRVGMNLDDAAQLAGVPRQTFFDWVRRGRQPGAAKVYRELVEEIDLALAEFKQRQLAGIDKAGGEEWQARAWLLERKFPDQYGRRTRVDSNVTVTAQPMWDTSKLTLPEKRELARLLRKCSPEPEQLEQGQAPVLELLPGGEVIDGEVIKESG